jgi:hypothetical protein
MITGRGCQGFCASICVSSAPVASVDAGSFVVTAARSLTDNCPHVRARMSAEYGIVFAQYVLVGAARE